MTDINSVVMTGRLTRDIEVRYTNSGTAAGSFSLAVNEPVRKGDGWEERANFFDCTLFGKAAESLKPYLTKGCPVTVSGRLAQDRWEKDGQKYSRVKILVLEIRLCGGGKNDGGKPGQQASSAPQAGFDGDFPEDIPF